MTRGIVPHCESFEADLPWRNELILVQEKTKMLKNLVLAFIAKARQVFGSQHASGLGREKRSPFRS